MIGPTNNNLLQQTEQEITAKIKPNMQQPFAMASHAAAQLFYSPAVQHRIMSQLSSTPNPIDNAAQSAANLTGVLMKQSQGKMPVPIAVPVATMLLCEILDFLEKAGKVQVTPDTLAQATHLLGNYVLRMLGVKQDQFHQVMAHGISQAQQAQGSQQALGGQQAPQSPQADQGGGIIAGARQGAQ